jgi:hypothetical protein
MRLPAAGYGADMFLKIRNYIAAAVFAGLAVFAAAPASADATYSLDLTFADGGTAAGTFTVANNGFLQNNYNVLTSGGSIAGYNYTSAANASPQFFDNGLYLVFNRPGYHGFLVLEFNSPLNGVGTYSLNLAGSFECLGFEQFNAGVPSNVCSSKRLLDANSPQSVDSVPEPASLALILSGLLAFSALALRRRVKPSTCKDAPHLA